MSFLTKGYSDLWKAIIRPPRDEYTMNDLGPVDYRIDGIKIKRTDLKIKNTRNQNMECSWWEPVDPPAEQLPCVIYLHGNSSSRVEALQCLQYLLPSNIMLFALDFAGCGKSEGEYISLGWYERDDVNTIVQYLRNSKKVSTIGLWGRSMGAVTALMHADRDPSIAGLVLDSAFSNLKDLSEELAKQHTSMPKFILSGVLSMIQGTIKDKANFDIYNLNPLENHVQQAFIPALFIAADGDTFIQPHHTKSLHEAYAGDQNLIMVKGNHNSSRPSFMMDSVSIFFYNTLQVDKIVAIQKPSKQEEKQDEQPKFLVSKKNVNVGNQDKVIDSLNIFGGGGGSKDSKKPEIPENNNFQIPGSGYQEEIDQDELEFQRSIEKAIQESLKNEQMKKNQNKTEEQQTEEKKSQNQQLLMDFFADDQNDNSDKSKSKPTESVSSQNKEQILTFEDDEEVDENQVKNQNQNVTNEDLI